MCGSPNKRISPYVDTGAGLGLISGYACIMTSSHSLWRSCLQPLVLCHPRGRSCLASDSGSGRPTAVNSGSIVLGAVFVIGALFCRTGCPYLLSTETPILFSAIGIVIATTLALLLVKFSPVCFFILNAELVSNKGSGGLTPEPSSFLPCPRRWLGLILASGLPITAGLGDSIFDSGQDGGGLMVAPAAVSAARVCLPELHSVPAQRQCR